jgi:gliding motility-associated lipoprotein GldH
MKRLINSLIYGLILWFAVACQQSQTIYHTFQRVNKEGWRKSDTLTFLAFVADTTSTFERSVEVRYLHAYPYQELYLTVTHNLKGYRQWETDTLKLDINIKRKWLTTGGCYLYQLNTPLTAGKARHPYVTFKVASAMKDPLLPGIHNVGLKIIQLPSEHPYQ